MIQRLKEGKKKHCVVLEATAMPDNGSLLLRPLVVDMKF